MEPKKDIQECFQPDEWGVAKSSQELMRVGSLVEYERRAQALTQEELSEKSGISQSQISRIERLECIPSFHTLYRLADALGKKLSIQVK